MADETTKPTKATPKGYKLAAGAKVHLRGLSFPVTNELLKDPRTMAVIQRVCPEAIGTLIVPA